MRTRKQFHPAGMLFGGLGSAIGDAFSAGKNKLLDAGKRLINMEAPRFITSKLGEVAEKAGLSNVIGKDAVNTGLDFVKKNIGNVF